MKIKQKLLSSLVASFAVAGFVVTPTFAATCGGANTAIIQCSQGDSGSSVKDNGIWGLLLIALNILTASVGIAAVGGIVYGAILYTSAADSTEQTKKAIEIIRNVVIGLVAYGLMYIGLNFIIPGGIFG